MLLINDRRAPIDLEPGCVPVLRWRDDDAVTVAADPAHGGDPVAYQIVVDETPADAVAGRGAIWASWNQSPASSESSDIWTDGDAWGGVALDGLDTGPSRRYWASLRWRYADGTHGAWAEPVMFGTGAGRAWRAAPIWGPDPDDLGNASGWAFLRGSLRLPDRPIRWATLNATAASTHPARQFVYRMWVNGTFVGVGPTFPIGDETRYDGYDVTGLLRPGGDNAIGVIAYTMDDRRFLAQLDVCYEDGAIEHYGTGGAATDPATAENAPRAMAWRALPEPWAVYPPSASIGTQYFEAPAENLNADRFPRGFSGPDFDDSAWAPVQVRPAFERLEATPTDKMIAVDVHPAMLRCVTRALDADDTAPRLVGVVADFGAGYMGGIRLDLDPREPIDVTIRYGETLNVDGSVRYHLSAGNVYEEHWHVTPGSGPLETWGLRVFRYVEIDVAQPPAQPSSWDVPTPTGLDERAAAIGRIMSRGIGPDGAISAIALVYPSVAERPSPLAYPGSFHSSDPALDNIWRLSAHTIEAFNGNIYADSWTRERAPYEADTWIQQRAHLALDAAPSLAEYTIDWLAANRTWPTEWPLYLILAAHDAWMYSGSAEFVGRLYDRLVALLPERYVDDESGLVVKEPGESSHMDGDLVDWPPSERDGFAFGEVNTVVNALASQAYADMAELAGVLGRGSDASRFARVAARMRSAIHERLYDADLGAYRDGLNRLDRGVLQPIDHASLHASAFALAFAEVPQSRVDRVAAFLRGRGMACSVYSAAAYLLGLYRNGFGADATAMITDPRTTHSWAYMLVQDAGGAMEAWDIARKPNTTYSHPWGASPAFLLSEGLMGVRPLEPGYRRFEVAPQPWAGKRVGGVGVVGDAAAGMGAVDCIREASVVVPTPAGDISVSYRVLAGESSASSACLDGESAARANDQSGAQRHDGLRVPEEVVHCVSPAPVLELDLTVPSRTRADVVLPTASYRELGPGHHHLIG
ncbi:hypothetical protein BW13_10200 [Bifidobacterium sp. UTCIF-37]|uniref:alpha-L-rhamnosidase-related protein n=1 Tax=unclassified Bifidobacterium TaxID=2608897 RepID=UPI00112AC824|nr:MULTISPECIES: family 78 glycoside hydrolase catalytic domain [unclassified Bifidobacterium]TPF85550.1 hypothetical protein BW13_10200 [Bifidobacterium sp. UTCIF-37]TPF87636.1 hypothetical protein BW11_10485 [Bifidobacterium sp. UTCIF-38]